MAASNSGNTLNIAFTPVTTFNPGGSGTIEVRFPYWFFLVSSGEYSYNPTAENKCTSECFRLTSSIISNDILTIVYE